MVGPGRVALKEMAPDSCHEGLSQKLYKECINQVVVVKT